MRSTYAKATPKVALFAVTVLLSLAGVSSAQTVNLTASQQTTTLSDGNTVPMWGWTCGTNVTGSAIGSVTVAAGGGGVGYAVGSTATFSGGSGTGATAAVNVDSTTGAILSINITNGGTNYTSPTTIAITPAPMTAATLTVNLLGAPSCTALTYNTSTGALNPQTGGWQPPLIVVPSAAGGADLTINLANSLPVETSIVIIGQVPSSATTTNGGLGTPVRETGPRTDGAHAGQTATTWTTVTPPPVSGFVPPTQGNRVRSFVPEVAGVATVGTTPAVGTYSWTGLHPGTYLIRTGTYPSIQGPMGLYGVLVVTKAPVGTPGTPGLAYPVTGSTVGGVTYDADVVALESEIDPQQNNMVAALFPTACTGAGVPVAACTAAGPLPAGTATANAGFSETAKWTPTCNLLTNTAAATCYPPAVDYTPVYFLINGLAFSTNNQSASALSVPAAVMTGNVLLRYVNAGSHMHVPTFVGLNMLLVAEDGYVLPDVALALTKGKTLTANPPAITSTTATQAVGLQVRNEVFQAAGKVMDVIVSPMQTTTAGTTTFAQRTYFTFDRSLALSSNGEHGVGMEAFLDVNDPNGAFLPTSSTTTANPDTYAYAPGVTLAVSDAGKGVIANDVNVYGVQLVTQAAAGTVTLYPKGTFTYVPTATAHDSFGYCANGTTLASVTPICTTVTLIVSSTANAANAPVANPDSYTSKSAAIFRQGSPGVLENDTDPHGFPLSAVIATSGCAVPAGATQLTAAQVNLSANGAFTATPGVAGSYYFCYQAKNSQNIPSNVATATLLFPAGSGLNVVVKDAQTGATISDYKWIIEQDLTLPINPACQVNTGTTTPPAGCPALPAGSRVPLTPATQFHASYYPIIAEGCTGPQSCEQGQTVYDAGTHCTTSPTATTPGVPAGCSPTAGQHVRAACDGYGICNTSLTQLPVSTPAQANLSATNPDGSPASYYISILSGDSQNAFAYANTKDPSISGNCTPGASEPSGITETSACGHTMGGGPIPATLCTGGTCTGTVTINLQQNPLKTATVTAYIFEDDYPLNGEPDSGGGIDVLATNEPALGDFQIEIWDDAGGVGDFTGQMTYDMFNEPLTNALNGTIDPATGFDACPISKTAGVAVGVIIVCPQYESDGKTLSPLTGQVVVRNLMQGKFSLIAHPSAVREANGEEWLQTNSLDGGHFLDSFIRVGEPPYFTEYGPAGYHVFFGFANPKIINARLAAICNGTNTPPCHNNINGQVTNLHQGRSPSEQLYSGAVYPQGDPRNYAMLGYTNCYAALGDSDGATIALTKCDPNGNFSFTNIPDGNYGLVLFDQWNDLIVDGSSHAVNVSGGQTMNMIYPSFTWQAHLWNRTYIDVGLKGRPVLTPDGSLDPILSPGLIQVPTRIRQRNGKFVNTLFSDVAGNTHFDETFPLFAFYTVESDTTRFRGTGVHVVNDNGGQVDGPAPVGNGVMSAYQGILNSKETFPLPSNLSVPGAVYCGNADCTDRDLSTNPTGFPSGPGVSTGRIDPGKVVVEAWQGGVSEFDIIDWGKTPYIPGENGGIRGHVVNSTTRPFDDPRMLFQNLWEPLVPNVTINLYQEGTAPDGTTSLTLVDTTLTSSWDSWAQGFNSTTGLPNMSCTGQDPADPFFAYTLQGTTNYLYPNTPLPPNPSVANSNAAYKCYDGYHNLNQLQPAPYDGLYQFPSQTCLAPGATFTVAGTVYHCATIPNPAAGQTGAAPAVLPSSATCVATPSLNCTGRYVTEVVLPPGWQLNKEEDLNLLIGDQYIAPVTQQFPLGLGNIYIVPDQAAINSINPSYTGPYTAASGVNGTSGPYNQPFTNCTVPGVISSCTFTPNTTNNGSPSTDWGRTSFGSFGPGGLIIQSAPCVGLMRVVPDYLSISPESGEVAPFAGSTRPLCDRKEVTLDDQMQANAEFFIYTMTPKATTFTGFISDDFSSEFDPAAPAFGEKFAIPNVPVSVKDFNGQEISRLYSDQFGTFNGLVYSTWEVDPPNITGYSPNMMITCMNDPGPIPGPGGTMITDPFYNPSYSNFCYENAFMPADAEYLDTPVVPTSGFAEGYNPPDCAYPDATPAIKSVMGDTVGGGAGPYIATQTNSFTITAAGDASGNQPVPNPAYSGPAATTAPYNQKFILRHYGFGAGAKVTVGGVPATCSGGDLTMTCTLPATPLVRLCRAGNPTYTGANASARCGEVVVTAANGKQSIDAVTLTIGGKAPTYINGENAANNALQTAIDQATPGDLIIVAPGTYYEMLIMWKPVRLQGVGAASVTLNANPHPSGKLDPWRRQMACLFGLALNGQPYSTPGNLVPLPGGGSFKPLNLYDPSGAFSCPGTGWVGFSGGPNNPQVDRLPLEGLVGWDTTVNGNLAEFLQEPSLLGAYEGAAISVVAKGVRFPAGLDVFGTGQDNAGGSFIAHESQMPVPTVELSTGDCPTSATNPNPYPSSFQCNPSRIDGLTITNSSQGGGGIFVHAWGHNLEIANNRIINNGGTLSGGITVGQGESPDALLSGNGGDPVGYNGGVLAGFDQQPWTCLPGAVIQTTTTPYGYDQVVSPPGTTFNQQLPYCYNTNVDIHNNNISLNAAYGDELFSSTPAGGGGVTLGTGADYYDFEQNWVCGNLSTGDGGGLAHLGFSYKGHITHNSILFNQSNNPTITAHGGGIVIMSTAPDGSTATQPECGSVTDADCAPGLGDGTGPGLVIDGNLIMGNTAESGSGGGIRLQLVNGTEMTLLPKNPELWNSVRVINNIIANNVAGWTGGGVSLIDALIVDFINNTVVSNDTTASAGVLFSALGAPLASVPPPGTVTTSTPQPAGLVTEHNSANLSQAIASVGVVCPVEHPQCTAFSNPVLRSNLFWQNRAFNITTNTSTGASVQLNPALTQPLADAITNGVVTGGTGACAAGASYWDIGVYTDSAPNNHASGLTLNPVHSILTDAADYATGNNVTVSSPGVVSQYCNGSRVPPEIAPLLCSGTNGFANAPGCIQPGQVGVGTTVPGGVPDSVVPPIPAFTLTPAATVDEGSNWINMFYGPLSMSNPVLYTAPGVVLAPLGNYNLVSGSPAIDRVPVSVAHPAVDFFGNPRPDPSNPNAFDIGAVEFQPPAGVGATVSLSAPTLTFGNQLNGTTSTPMTVTLTNNGGAIAAISYSSLAGTGFTQATGGTTNCGANLGPGAVCNFTIAFAPPQAQAGPFNAILTLTFGAPATPATLTVGLSGTSFLLFSPTSIAFGNQQVGTTSAAHSATLTNQGASPLTITAIALGGTNPLQFVPVTTCGGLLPPITLAAGSSCAVSEQFAPTTVSAKTANLNFTVTGGTNPYTVMLSGTGVSPTFGLSPASLSFGNRPDHTTSTSQPVTLSNTGVGPLTITGIAFTGTNPLVFSQTNNCPASPATLAVGAACTVNVSFAPGVAAGSSAAAGLKNANLSVTATNAATQTVGLTGTTTVATVSFSAPAPTLVNGATTAHSGTVTLTNNTTSMNPGPLTLTATPTVTRTVGTGAFTVTGGTCVSGLTIAAGGTCTIVVQYAPPGNTSVSTATVTVNDTGATATSQTSSGFNAN